MGFETIIIKAITRVIKSTFRFEIAIDDILEKFKDSPPSKEELKNIIKQKNQITLALNQITGTITTLNVTSSTLNTIVTGVGVAVRIIKTLPIPTSVPPGFGIPVNVITNFADSLDSLRELIKKSKGALSVVPPATDAILSSAKLIVNKLNKLDTLITISLEKQTEGMTEEEKQEYFTNINLVMEEVGNFSNPKLNIISEKSLLSQLEPNSPNPITHNDYVLEIQYDDKNIFSFPARRIKGVNYGLKHTLYNLPNQGYSFSNSVKVLIDEIKFRIDNFIYPPIQGSQDIENLIEVEETSSISNKPPKGKPKNVQEIKEVNDVYYQYNSLNEQWEIIMPEFPPFGEAGTKDKQKRWYIDTFYFWNQELYKWEPS